MIRIPVDMSRYLPMTRETATVIASAASRYVCTLTLEEKGIVLNMKSMIGLLSQSIPKDGQMILVADGTDERQAAEEIRELLLKKR